MDKFVSKIASEWFQVDQNTSKFDENFIKKYNKNLTKDISLKSATNNLNNYIKLHDDLPFLPEEIKLGSCEKLNITYTVKKNMLYISVL